MGAGGALYVDSPAHVTIQNVLFQNNQAIGGTGGTGRFETFGNVAFNIADGAAATDLPVMVYDIPIRSGRKITTATLLRLFREVRARGVLGNHEARVLETRRARLGGDDPSFGG